VNAAQQQITALLANSHEIRQVLLKEVIDFVERQEQIFYLKHRWMDEKEYEDFLEYKVALQNIFEEAGYKIKSINESFTIKIMKDAHLITIKILLGSFKVRVD
jgi:hypothetical protein